MTRWAVVDTNVLVSALMKPGSLPATVAQAVRDGTLVPVVCSEIVAEYRAVLLRPRLALPPKEVAELVELIEQQSLWVRIVPYPSALKLPDPYDWPFIACALAIDCPVVTGNLKHFPVRSGVRALSVRNWQDTQRAL